MNALPFIPQFVEFEDEDETLPGVGPVAAADGLCPSENLDSREVVCEAAPCVTDASEVDEVVVAAPEDLRPPPTLPPSPDMTSNLLSKVVRCCQERSFR